MKTILQFFSENNANKAFRIASAVISLMVIWSYVYFKNR